MIVSCVHAYRENAWWDMIGGVTLQEVTAGLWGCDPLRSLLMLCLTSLLPPWAHWKLRLWEAVSSILANIPTQVLCLFFLPESNPGEWENHLPAVDQQEMGVDGSISQPPNPPMRWFWVMFSLLCPEGLQGRRAVVVTHPVTVTGFSLFHVSLFPFP